MPTEPFWPLSWFSNLSTSNSYTILSPSSGGHFCAACHDTPEKAIKSCKNSKCLSSKTKKEAKKAP